MVIKPRSEPIELKLLKYLHTRTNLSDKEMNKFRNLEKGYEGEKVFDELLENLPNDLYLILNDLFLETNNTIYQINTLLISHEKILLFEIKNYDSDFCITDDRWYTSANSEIKDPLLQLKRSEDLLRQLLDNLGFNIPLKPYLTFVNPNFFLYEAPLNLPIIFPTHLRRFFKQLHSNTVKVDDRHSRLAEKLISLHLNSSPYTRIPNYAFETIGKGIVCVSCQSLNTVSAPTEHTIFCRSCTLREITTTAILRTIDEFKLLFPNKKITTKIIYLWWNKVIPQRNIQRILSKHYKKMGYGRASYYV
ncbi:nuclease-related domain-containing protein [Alkalihalobacterium elongatum]|uniref:nuclease-related domain-containing protein n=1 Tax=Alkalihalobacterium elongatum TaxID=2675466 RepID=UPI001C1F60A2|nr:nuclease-related domain-containing protein [Alkalihalobacterium elongatum]